MAEENARLDATEEYSASTFDTFDFDELEDSLQSQLEEEFSGMDFLESEREKIGNPDELGKVILDEIWKQFGNQIGLDMTNETLIQKYDRENPETYEEVGKKVMQDKKYKDANKAMKEQQQAGQLDDAYTGEKIKKNDSANLDHVVSRKELYENQRRKQAGLSVEDVANKPENLKPTNESLNKSKGAKTINEYLEKREEREKDLKEQNERKNKEIDNSNKSENQKRLEKEKNNKALQNKLAADDDLMKKADKEARKAINKDIAIGATKETCKKAGKDALKTMAISALFSLLKEVMNGLVRFLKSQAKSFESFLSEMKESIKSFLSKITRLIQTGTTTLVGTIVSEIYGPIVSTFKKMASFIKQGVGSVIEAIKYLSDKENRDKPFSEKVAQVGKIITASLFAGGAIVLGEVFEKVLETVPGMQIQLPLLGSLANVIGMFLASLVSGLVGAIVINLIDKSIAKRQEADLLEKQIDKGNEVLVTQSKILDLNIEKLVLQKEHKFSIIEERHNEAARVITDSVNNVFDEKIDQNERQDNFDELNGILDNLSD